MPFLSDDARFVIDAFDFSPLLRSTPFFLIISFHYYEPLLRYVFAFAVTYACYASCHASPDISPCRGDTVIATGIVVGITYTCQADRECCAFTFLLRRHFLHTLD